MPWSTGDEADDDLMSCTEVLPPASATTEAENEKTTAGVGAAAVPDAPPPAPEHDLGSSEDESGKDLTAAKTANIDVEHVPVNDDPRAWSRTKKNLVLAVVAAIAFIASMASSIFFPAVPQVQADLRATSGQVALTASLFILFQGVFPTFWAAGSEIVGRRPCYFVSSVFFIGASIGCALAPSIGALIGLRVLQSCGASAVLSIGAGSLADMYDTHERGQKMGIFYGSPLLAQSAGPLIGGGLTLASSWRATFWFCTAYGSACFIAQIWLPEPFRKERSLAWRKAAKRAEAIARQKAVRKAEEAELRASSESSPTIETPDKEPSPPTPSTTTTVVEPAHDAKDNDLPPVRAAPSQAVSLKDGKLVMDDGTSAEIKVTLADVNPFSALGAIVRKPNNLFLSTFTGLYFGQSYCLLYTGGITFAEPPYSHNPLIVGCILLAFGCGNIAGSILGGRYSDYVYAKLKVANNDVGEPEFRIRSTYPALLMIPAVLVGYAWAVDQGVSLGGVCVLLFLNGLAGIWAYSSLLAYVVDANPGRASSAVAFNSACRGFAACIASQIADPLLQRMGHGWFYTAWAGTLLVGELTLLVVERRGKAWREGTSQQGRRILSARQKVPDETVATAATVVEK